ncbi:MAG: NTP transferase domain-containing protein [Phycisphaeraceae bacterium]
MKPAGKQILCILAGGRSRRFGSSKLNLHLAGTPIAAWLLARLRRGLPVEGWLSVAPGVLPPGTGAFDRILVDRVPFAGPLAAMMQVLSQAPLGSLIVFAAADMPMISPVHVASMVRQLSMTRSLVGVMSRWVNGPRCGRCEPLPCVFRAGRGARLLRQAWQAGLRGPQQLSSRREVGCANLSWPRDEGDYLNINRREDLKKLSAISFQLSAREILQAGGLKLKAERCQLIAHSS